MGIFFITIIIITRLIGEKSRTSTCKQSLQDINICIIDNINIGIIDNINIGFIDNINQIRNIFISTYILILGRSGGGGDAGLLMRQLGLYI